MNMIMPKYIGVFVAAAVIFSTSGINIEHDGEAKPKISPDVPPEAMVQSEAGAPTGQGSSLLDIAKHTVKTIQGKLKDTFSSAVAKLKPADPSKDTKMSALAKKIEVNYDKAEWKAKRDRDLKAIQAAKAGKPPRKKVAGYSLAADQFATHEAVRIMQEEKATKSLVEKEGSLVEEKALRDNALVPAQPQSPPDAKGISGQPPSEQAPVPPPAGVVPQAAAQLDENDVPKAGPPLTPATAFLDVDEVTISSEIVRDAGATLEHDVAQIGSARIWKEVVLPFSVQDNLQFQADWTTEQHQPIRPASGEGAAHRLGIVKGMYVREVDGKKCGEAQQCVETLRSAVLESSDVSRRQYFKEWGERTVPVLFEKP